MATAFLAFVSCVRVPRDIIELHADLGSGCEDVSYTEICEGVELIPLPVDCRIFNYSSTPELTSVHNGKIYILDENTGTLFAFDMKGNLLQRSQKRGRGPGEFTNGCGILVNENHGTLDVLDAKGYVMRYKLEDFSFSDRIDFLSEDARAFQSFALDDDGYYLFSYSDKNHLFHYLESEARMDVIPMDKPRWYYRNYLSSNSPFARVNGVPVYVENFDGTIFYIDEKACSLKAAYKWNVGSKALDFSDIPKNMGLEEYVGFKMSESYRHFTSYFYIWESDSFIHSCVYYESRPCNLFYRKADGKTFLFDRTREGVFFLGGVLCDNSLYSYCSVGDLGMALGEEMYLHNEEVMNSNACIIRYKLK